MPAGDPVPVRIDFDSGGTMCAASHYRGSNGACVVMAGGLGATRGPATGTFAKRFNADGFTVLAFDYRRFGDSAGRPRQVVRISEQLEDWHNAVRIAQALPDVDPDRVALWGFSLGGGHVIRVAGDRSDVAAAIAQAPTADGVVAARNAMRHARPWALMKLTAKAVGDALGSAVGASPTLVPVAGTRGDVAMLTTPDAVDAPRALDPGGAHPEWDPRVAARFALTSALYRPGSHAAQVRCPLLVLAYEDDLSALPGPAARAAERAPAGRLVRRPGGHYASFLSDLDETYRVEVRFLREHLLGDPT